MTERIQKIIAARGICSRREAERLISEGKVKVDGRVCALGESADPETQSIEVNGVMLPSADENVYVMLNKPRGIITSMSDEKGRPTVKDMVSDCPHRIYPVGRLDYDSDGLLLMTNDGELTNKLMHPSSGIFKTYRVTVSGNAISAVGKLKSTISVDGVNVKAKKVELLSSSPIKSVLNITIGEGRNRQVRKMCASCGLEVITLTRVSEGPMVLGDLQVGKWRYLSNEEVLMLKNAVL